MPGFLAFGGDRDGYVATDYRCNSAWDAAVSHVSSSQALDGKWP